MRQLRRGKPDMQRREFITLLGGAAVGWPLAAGAQQSERMHRVGVLMLYVENDPEGRLRAQVFQQGLEKLGWIIGRNLRIDYHWGVGDGNWIRSAAAELLTRAPDVILANGGPAVRAVQQSTHTVSTVFIGGADPVADGFVQSLARPGGNFTGFTTLETSVGAKLLELLKEVAPGVTRVAVLINPDNPGSLRLAQSAASAAQKLGADVVAAPVRESAEIEALIRRWASEPGAGLIVPPDPSTNSHRRLIVELAARYRLPAIHALRAATAEGGLMSYGISVPDLFRQAAVYVDRILRGEKPADLPVQQPTKFELAINLKTAKSFGLTVPLTLQASADEVIE
jgi:putative tryptophan/tyrosine transport system substrate-binding protein